MPDIEKAHTEDRIECVVGETAELESAKESESVMRCFMLSCPSGSGASAAQDSAAGSSHHGEK
jgi:hypothetical protein